MARQVKDKAEGKDTEEKPKTETKAAGKKKDRNLTVNAPQGLNLREGPHKSYPVLTTLGDGAEAELLPLPGGATVPGWSLVTARGYTGWVMEEFLRPTEET